MSPNNLIYIGVGGVFFIIFFVLFIHQKLFDGIRMVNSNHFSSSVHLHPERDRLPRNRDSYKCHIAIYSHYNTNLFNIFCIMYKIN